MLEKISSNIGIEKLIKQNPAYAKQVLRQRQQFITLRLRQDTDIKNLFERLAGNIAEEISKGGLSDFDAKRYAAIQDQLLKEAESINKSLEDNFKTNIRLNMEVGGSINKQIVKNLVSKAGVKKITPDIIDKRFNNLYSEAVAAAYHRTENNFTLSGKIWEKTEEATAAVRQVLIDGVSVGENCVTVAQKLEKYVATDKVTLAKEYPEMMKRMGGRIPKSLSYEALRLARTEMTAAYGLGTMKTASYNPANRGVRFTLSASHPVYDICDPICDADDYGLGKGGYPLDQAPPYPFHPNCLCIVSPINEEPDTMIDRLKQWEANPEEEPELEKWYNDNYI